MDRNPGTVTGTLITQVGRVAQNVEALAVSTEELKTVIGELSEHNERLTEQLATYTAQLGRLNLAVLGDLELDHPGLVDDMRGIKRRVDGLEENNKSIRDTLKGARIAAIVLGATGIGNIWALLSELF